MKSITSDTPVSTEIPHQHHSLQEIEDACNSIGLFPSPPNRSRVARALNIAKADAVHCIQNGNGHQVFAVQSQSNSHQFYTVQGKDIVHLECECPDALNGFECKHVFAVRLANARRTEDEFIAEKERELAEYEANRWSAEDMCEGTRAAHLAEASADYQTAKARFNQTTTRSASRPDSLTRRGGTLIAAKFYGQYDKQMISQWWTDSIRELFPNATIHKTTVSRWYTVRCYFSI